MLAAEEVIRKEGTESGDGAAAGAGGRRGGGGGDAARGGGGGGGWSVGRRLQRCLSASAALAAGGGVLGKLTPLYRIGIGSPLAPGSQWQSWIHIDDLVSLFMAAMEKPEWDGPFNAVSPAPIPQETFSRSLAKVLGRPHVLPAIPQWAIRLLYGEAANALLASHRILPAKAMAAGFEFQHQNLDDAFRDILR